jgi:hypothetical protein
VTVVARTNNGFSTDPYPSTVFAAGPGQVWLATIAALQDFLVKMNEEST